MDGALPHIPYGVAVTSKTLTLEPRVRLPATIRLGRTIERCNTIPYDSGQALNPDKPTCDIAKDP
ncbi:hypothetical protein PROFUN_05643 [Planoprotostelium fungivorum]|uniref:Uncharacterized protein n=1 Tax=Planoprotostelium fungivorum TaxID=1890364 RepID=A0A2P6MUE4_9EUKA|nr:hypothetical protein PROFUN_05643 [Planoprotostelium fungivorum]